MAPSQLADTETPGTASARPKEPELAWYISVANHSRSEIVGRVTSLSKINASLGFGRDVSCVWEGALDDPTISRNHAKVTLQRDGLWLEHLGKTETTLNGNPIKSAMLAHGDLIGIGHEDAVHLIVYRAPAGYEIPQDPTLIGISYAVRQLLDKIHSVARSPVDVLLHGERGTGKELVARAIHVGSERKGEFCAVNCGEIPEGSLQSELFGHVRGAFTEAHRDRKGLILTANKGTFLLDEIAYATPAVQDSLVRFLQERKVRPVGGDSPIKVDVRVIAASNIDLKDKIEQKKFRADLYDRLAQWEFYVPPLRERKEDIPVLALHFVRKYAREWIRMHGKTMLALFRYDWPGNVRQLENVVRQAALESKGKDRIRLSEDRERQMSRAGSDTPGRKSALDEECGRGTQVKKPSSREELIELFQHLKSRAEIARACRVSRQAVAAWCKKYGLSDEEQRARKG